MNRRNFLRTFSAAIALPPMFSKAWQWQHDEDAILCAKKFELAVSKSLQTKPINEVVIEIGKSFLGTDYVAHTLEVSGDERLVVNLHGLDCVTFCENAFVLARCIKKGTMTFEDYKKELQFLRYLGGIINQYSSRLHYFYDYIFDNEKKGVWKNITKELGGIPYKKRINFISTHPKFYRQLTEHPEFIKVIEQQEAQMSGREMFYIPKQRVDAIAERIQSGDLIATTTDIDGLDVSHTGIAIRERGKLRLLHAPDVGYKVSITELSLAEYLAKNKHQTGIIVVRAMESKRK